MLNSLAPSRRDVLGGGAALAAGLLLPKLSSPAKPITVTDQRGVKLALDGPAKRVVTIVIPAASMVVAIAGSSKPLVGMNSSSMAAIKGYFLGEDFPQLEKVNGTVANATFAPNVETIVGLNPDLVIQWGDRGTGITSPLENAGLKVMGLTYGTQGDLEQWVTMFAAVLGVPSRGRKLIKEMHATQSAVESAAASFTDKPSILEFGAYTNGMQVAGEGSYTDFFIDLVGARNAAGNLTEQAATVSAEQVIAMDPDIILMGNFDPATPKTIYQNPTFQSLTAVKNRRVYQIPLGGYRWDPPSQESPLMWRWLQMIAHPGKAGIDLRQQIVTDYKFLYGKVPTKGQLDQILRLGLNDESADYGRFHA